MNTASIKIKLSDNNRPHIETATDYTESIFLQQYNLCFNQINSILLANQSVNLEEGIECNNNIIVFDGDRGSGKTSCMMSVANILVEHPANFFEEQPELKKQKFLKLPMLEPSFFDSEHNAVTLFVSRLYKEYLKTDKSRHDDQTRHNLLNQFVSVQQSIKCILGDFEPKDGLDYLVGLSSAVDLRSDIYKLVSLFLDYIGQKESKLLVLIDDIDINPQMAEDMAEQVRKYLVLPNVVVLASMKIEQLTGILFRKYSNEYEISKRCLDDDEKAEIKNRVEKYVTKLFPRSHRVYMPLSDSILRCKIELENRDLWSYNLPEDLLVRQIVPELIFKKTRYLFYNTNKRESFIVPRNLRDLRQMLHLLLSMPEYADEKEEHPHLENKLSFKKYLFEDWVTNNFDEKSKRLASKLVAVEVMEELNYTTLSVLIEYANSISWNQGNNVAVDEALDKLNNTSNISLGDVVSIIRIIENANPDEDNRKFLFFIRTLYSIRLYEAYDSITMSREKSDIRYSHTVVNRGLHRMVKNDYEAIVGGSVFNADIFDILPVVSENVRISSRFITKDSLVGLSKHCLKHWDEENGIYVKLMELLMMSVYYDNAAITTVQNNFRKNENVCYRVISAGAKEYRFDLGALIFNMGRPVDAINRFRAVPELKDFFKKYGSYSRERYLMSEMYDNMESEHCRTKEYKEPEERWLSYCSFRNMEILEDFLNFIRGRVQRTLGSNHNFDQSKPTDSLLAFFLLASAYSIKSYDRYDNEHRENNSYKIDFKFYMVIKTLMETEKFRTEFDKVFNSKEQIATSNNENIETGNS